MHCDHALPAKCSWWIVSARFSSDVTSLLSNAETCEKNIKSSIKNFQNNNVHYIHEFHFLPFPCHHCFLSEQQFQRSGDWIQVWIYSQTRGVDVPCWCYQCPSHQPLWKNLNKTDLKILFIVCLQYISIFQHVPQRPSVWLWTTFITISSFLEHFIKLFLRSKLLVECKYILTF